MHWLNRRIHDICVPAIAFSLLGLLWTAPGLEIAAVTVRPVWLLLLLVLPYYLVLSVRLGVLVLAGLLLMLAVIAALDRLQMPLAGISLAVFLAAWLAQFVGHRIEGKSPSFFKDLQFLLIGPLWVAHKAVGRLRSQQEERSRG